MTRDEICSKFLDSLAYDLYPFQEEAILAWFADEPGTEGGTLVAAPTGMGKTLIAEAAVFEALHSGTCLYYTTPLIALTEQKFRELQSRAVGWGFRPEDVGLITGNRKENPEAPVRVVVAEILLNHLLAGEERLAQTSAVVMDEFHNFNDQERGIVWELSLVLLPPATRLMLLSATVGNAAEFIGWLARQHGRKLRLVQSQERRVPLEFLWIGDKLLTEHLPEMVQDDDAAKRSPALVFCFNRDECWEVAERLKGASLISAADRAAIEQHLPPEDFSLGVGPKLKQMLIRGVGVHHAGVLPRHKEIVERLFNQKLVPFVICTETLAAGVNLPARSVVLSTLLKGKHGDKKLVPPSAAHQMFGRAGRPQFDTRGYVYALAHEDDVKIEKWKKKYDHIDANSKEPGMMRMRKELERKRPTRRKTEQYWTEGQFKSLIAAGPARLFSRSMIPYQVLIYLLTRTGTLHEVRDFLGKRFNTDEWIANFQAQLDSMIGNLAAFGYLTRAEDGDHITLHESINALSVFRSVDPLYGAFLADKLARGNADEKVLALESVLALPPNLERHVRIPTDLPPGPLQTQELQPQLVAMGAVLAKADGSIAGVSDDEGEDFMEEPEEKRPPNLPEMLLMIFENKLAVPDRFFMQPKWVAGAAFLMGHDFFKFVGAHNLVKQEGIVLRHLLRLVVLSGEFFARTSDPEYQNIAEQTTRICEKVDARYTDKFLAEARAALL